MPITSASYHEKLEHSSICCFIAFAVLIDVVVFVAAVVVIVVIVFCYNILTAC